MLPDVNAGRDVPAFTCSVFRNPVGPLNPDRFWRLKVEEDKPLPALDPEAPDFLAKCHSTAATLLDLPTSGPWPWLDAEIVITGMLAFVCAHELDPAQRNLSLVRLLVTDRGKFRAAVELMRHTDRPMLQLLA